MSLLGKTRQEKTSETDGKEALLPEEEVYPEVRRHGLLQFCKEVKGYYIFLLASTLLGDASNVHPEAGVKRKQLPQLL